MPRNIEAVKPEVRQFALLRLLKRGSESGGGLTLYEVRERLNSANGWNFTRKTYERDIDNLSGPSGVTSDGGHPERFSLSSDYKESYQLRLTEDDLPTLAMALGLFKAISPEYLGGLTDGLEARTIQAMPKYFVKEYDRFKDLILVQRIASGKAKQKLQPDMTAVLKAFQKGVTIKCYYHSPWKTKDSNQMTVRHFGLIALELFGGSPYVLVQDLDVQDSNQNSFKRLKISRLSGTRFTAQKFERPPRSKYSAWLDSFEGIGGNNDKPISITVIGTALLAAYFSDREIHPSQTLIHLGPDKCKLELKMPISPPLVRLLAGFGAEISSVHPMALKRELLNIWSRGHRLG